MTYIRENNEQAVFHQQSPSEKYSLSPLEIYICTEGDIAKMALAWDVVGRKERGKDVWLDEEKSVNEDQSCIQTA